jgi:hypothetical protein
MTCGGVAEKISGVFFTGGGGKRKRPVTIWVNMDAI